MTELWRDLRFSFRVLAKAPGFIAISVLTLALGIGANSTIFTWVNATLLNPIPGLTHGAEVVAATHNIAGSLSYPDFKNLRERDTSFSGMTAYSMGPMSLTGKEKPERVWGMLVTSNYFPVLGVQPVLGRGFLPSEDTAANGAPVALISYRLWQRRFGGDRSIVGRTIDINTHPFTVIGVTPPVFQGSYSGLRAELWMPVTMTPELAPGAANQLVDRGTQWLQVLGRLRPGVDRERAQAELTTLEGQLARQYPDSHRGENRITLYPLWRAPNGANAFFSKLLPILMALAGAVLLLACANLANLLLARGISRQRELAIRLSLGAGRARLVRQLLLESLTLSLAGGALALLLTFWAAGQFMNFAPVSNLPIWISVTIDRRVLLATLLLSIVTTMLFGMLPALRAVGIQPANVLKEEAGSVAGGGRKARLSNALAIAQIALSLGLLVSAGLFIRSFRATHQFDPGFDPRNVLLESYDLYPNGYAPADGIAFHRQVLQNARALSGVRAACLADWVPLGFGASGISFTPEGYVPGPHEAITAGFAHISPDYFATMRIPLVRGRDFNTGDSSGSAPVVIVNQALAGRYWAGQDAIGKRMKIEGHWATIVGVVQTTDYYDLNEPPHPFLYLPLFQSYTPDAVLHVRTAGDPLAAAETVTDAIHRLNADLPVYDISTLEARTSARTFTLHMAGTFVGVFGGLALALAAIGLYGVIAYGVRQRTHEIGIRMALGAHPAVVRKLVLGRGARLTLVGVGIGLAGALGLTRLFRSVLFGVGAADTVTYVFVTLLLVAVSLAACYIPAWRAARVDPMVALRHQ
ncbi:MAG TPA: ABC transporter permease [Candidatus Acidoferrales bacterium]|nr:ABC transporter permease [Candidatus Acidoferrales bacterium]